MTSDSFVISKALKRQLWVLMLLLSLAGCKDVTTVETVVADNRRLEVSFTERAETELRQEYPITMPVNGKISRIELEVGDRVRKDETLVRIDATPALQEVEARQASVQASKDRQSLSLDTSVETSDLRQAQKRVTSVRAEIAQVAPAIEAARTALANARKEESRVDKLVASGALPAKNSETARLVTVEAEANLVSQKTRGQVLQGQLAEARAAVNTARARIQRKALEAQAQSATIREAQARTEQAAYTLSKAQVSSPIDGVVLKRHERGPKELMAGAPLLTLGRTEDLEVVCEVLSQDALRLSRGTNVFLDAGSAFSTPLRGEVRLKEPQGFTKRSSLGVEQQRVRVRIGLLNPPEDLGSGYELWARFQLSETTTLTLPRACFVRYGQSFKVWRVTPESTLELVEVEVGLKGDKLWEVTGSSLKAKDQVVSDPSETLTEGLEVKIQAQD